MSIHVQLIRLLHSNNLIAMNSDRLKTLAIVHNKYCHIYIRTCPVGTHRNHLVKVIPMSTHRICNSGLNRGISLAPRLIWWCD